MIFCVQYRAHFEHFEHKKFEPSELERNFFRAHTEPSENRAKFFSSISSTSALQAGRFSSERCSYPTLPGTSRKYSSHSINFSYGTLNYQCVSRIDETDHKVFHPKGKNQGRRWNLYSQIAIDNDTLHCAKESYDLTEICDDNKGFWGSTKPCTLQDTNEVVELDYEGYV